MEGTEMTAGFQKNLQKHRLIIAAGIILVLAAAGCGEKPVETKEVIRPVKIMTIGSGGDTVGRKFPGNVRASQKVDLAFNVAGTLVELSVKESDDVKDGQLIARLDQRDFKSKLAASKSKYESAKADYDRNLHLFKEGIIPKSKLDKLERNFEVYDADVKIAQNTFDDTSLAAPFTGRIAKRYVDNFKEVQAKEPIVSLQDISSIEIVVDVPEWVMVPIRERGSSSAFAEFPAAPGRKFPLKVKEFASEADPQTQTYRVVLIMPAPEDVNILPGMTATVTAPKLKDSLNQQSRLVPVDAVFADESGNNHVWRVNESMQVEKQAVAIGSVTGESIRILDGLSPGDKIVTAGVNYLQPGMKVRQLKDNQGD
jgi:RND family efflux transporter MFP subunit